MNLLGLLNIVIALVIVLVVALVLFIQYLKTQEKEIKNTWSLLLLKIRKRADMIPLMVDKAKESVPGIHAGELLELRAKALNLGHCDGEKVEAENALTAEIHSFLERADAHKELLKNPYFLALKEEIVDAAEAVELEMQLYNTKVRKFNKAISLPFLIPLKVFVRFYRRHLFEFKAVL